MVAIRHWLGGQWVEGTGAPRELVSAVNGAVVATVRTGGLDVAGAWAYGRDVGGPALRALTFAQRGAVLKALADLVVAHRDELLDLSTANYGATRKDGKFDVDGASATLSFYSGLGEKLGARSWLVDGEAEGLLRSKRFVGQHLLLPRRGVALHINAFNFPAWGMAEKLAVSLLAGVPAISKPATATALVAARLVQIWVEAGVLPAGALQFVAGNPPDLLDHVGPQDAVAFTGSGDTGRIIRSHPAVVRHNVRVNVEADSLNGSVVGRDVEVGSDSFQMFVNDVLTDLVQKAGQKCTAVRRIFVPADRRDEIVATLVDRLSAVVVGDPSEKGVEIGPLATPAQKADIDRGLAELQKVAPAAWRGKAPEGGCFVAPGLFVAASCDVPYVHEHEVFGPAATVLPYKTDAELFSAVAKGGGGLVCSLYTDDLDFAGKALVELAPWHGRIQWGSAKIYDQGAGPGTVLPNLVHGGPGKAGGGEELGGMRGMSFYLQRTAVQAERGLLQRVLEAHGHGRSGEGA